MSGPPAANDVNDSDDRMVEIVHSARLRNAAGGPVVVLVGVPGAGKSTVGRALAQRLGVGFRDTDADVESTTGRAIADIFVESGEPEFRRLEAAAISNALSEHAGVLALGGGAVIDPATRALLVGGPVVWLRVGLAAASQRAGLSGARPVLLGNVRAQLKSLMDARAPLYTEVARLIVDTDELTVEETVETILAALGSTPDLETRA
jgi:shikimate kinase